MRKRDGSDDKISGSCWQLWGIPLYGRGMGRVLKLVEDQIDTNHNKPFWVATVNPEFVMEAAKDRHFLEILQETDLNVMDGVGLIWAQMMKEGNGWHRENLVPGVELMDRMCQLAERKGKRNGLKPFRTKIKNRREGFTTLPKIYFLGGFGDRAERTAKYFKNKYINIEVGWSQGRPIESNNEVLEKINKFKPDFLFVAYGMKKQELWIEDHFDRLKVKVVMGVGRSFDYFSGDLKRAPEWVRKMGLEWLYSLYKEPKRWKRQLALPKFVWKVIFGKN
jgi:N-acetylglucosaminyldiphosphoundecaprenol N-acetyl-beta-D-mannosaminyltransferase